LLHDNTKGVKRVEHCISSIKFSNVLKFQFKSKEVKWVEHCIYSIKFLNVKFQFKSRHSLKHYNWDKVQVFFCLICFSLIMNCLSVMWELVEQQELVLCNMNIIIYRHYQWKTSYTIYSSFNKMCIACIYGWVKVTQTI
jgi:hypothetical protein